MSTTVAASGITGQIWQRLVRQGDSNGDSRLDAAELDALKAGGGNQTDMAAILSAFDSDGDGGLSAGELPSAPLGAPMLGPLLDWQEYGKADAATRAADDARVVDDLFARADVDGDGLLSPSEWNAEMTMRSTRWLEAQASVEDPVYIVRRGILGNGSNEAALSREDIGVGRYVPVKAVVIPHDQLAPEVRAEIAEHAKRLAEYNRTHPTEVPPPPPTPEQRRQQVTEKILSAPLDTSYLTRLLAQLSASIAQTKPDDATA